MTYIALDVWEDAGLFDQLIVIHIQVPTNTYVFKTFWQGIKLVVIHIQIPTHLQMAEIYRESLQLIVRQAQSLTHLQLPKFVGRVCSWL